MYGYEFRRERVEFDTKEKNEIIGSDGTVHY